VNEEVWSKGIWWREKPVIRVTKHHYLPHPPVTDKRRGKQSWFIQWRNPSMYNLEL
jgi:hypothetical protein